VHGPGRRRRRLRREAKGEIAGAAAPTAINAAMLVHESGDGYDEAGFVAAAVFASTLFSALTVTVVLTLLRWGGF
jgi:predicted permease